MRTFKSLIFADIWMNADYWFEIFLLIIDLNFKFLKYENNPYLRYTWQTP